MKYPKIREEELKNKVAHDYFWQYDCTKIVGDVDFCVAPHQAPGTLFEQETLLWAEAKRDSANIYASVAQLVLTIGKARTFDKFLPPPMLGAFDGEKIAFVPYSDVQELFYQNDFNWNVAPSNHSTREFGLVLGKVTAAIDQNALLFRFDEDDRELRRFIKANFVVGKFGLSKTRIDKNNFIFIYTKWLQEVKPTIAANWDLAKKNGIIDGDFYLADLLSLDNSTLKDKLYVLLRTDHYEINRKIDDLGFLSSRTTTFTDKQKAHNQFWNRYERPPQELYWDYIVERRDLLVPQDVRERKGSFFTPQQWVELSQRYLAYALGPDWQDEYYVWDCAAGTGNLLAGLTNKYNIWASTLDKQDVDVMHDRIETMNRNSASGFGATLLPDHVFQFDFLNDEFTKLPKSLQDVINDPKKRRKLVVYINPPYAEAGNKRTMQGLGENKSNVSSETKIYQKYQPKVGTATRGLFVQFLIRINYDIPGSIIAQFSKIKHIQSQNFEKFRQIFKVEFKTGFLVPANSFDNVKGHFPIGFFVWNLNTDKSLGTIECDIYEKGVKTGTKKIFTHDKGQFIINWLRNYYDKTGDSIGYLRVNGPDVQNNLGVFMTNHPSANDEKKHFIFNITEKNLLQMAIYFTVRLCVASTWVNDRDQYAHPTVDTDFDPFFQTDCLAFALFHGQNRISSRGKANHWIPFTEYEVASREKFASNFMTDFITGRLGGLQTVQEELFGDARPRRSIPLEFSPQAKAVFKAGQKLWQHYHRQPGCNVNASLYDIKEHFQGRTDGGDMNKTSSDPDYSLLMNTLRDAMADLAERIEPKVYEYGFLKR